MDEQKAKFNFSINGWSWVHCNGELLCTIIMDEEASTWLWNHSRHYVCVLWQYECDKFVQKSSITLKIKAFWDPIPFHSWFGGGKNGVFGVHQY